MEMNRVCLQRGQLAFNKALSVCGVAGVSCLPLAFSIGGPFVFPIRAGQVAPSPQFPAEAKSIYHGLLALSMRYLP